MKESGSAVNSKARFRSLLSPELQFLDDADLLQLYAYPLGLTAPWFRANMVSSIDGSAAFKGGSKGLTSASDRRLFHLMRALADVILIGAGTARSEPYRNHKRQVVVITRSGDLPTHFFTGIPPIVITTEAISESRRAALARKCEVIVFGRHEVDLVLMRELFIERGWLKVLCEGGPALLGSINTEAMVDELALTIAPLLAGSGSSLLQESPEIKRNFDLLSLLEAEGNLFARYVVH